MTYLTLGFPLKYHRWREADRFYTVYTKDYGKLELLARGANKIKSKLAGHLEPGLLSNLMIASGKSWDILAQAKAVFFSNFLRNLGYNATSPDNYQKFILFLSCLEVLDKLTKLEDPHPEVFDLLVNVLKCLDQTNQISTGYCWIFFLSYFIF